MPPLVLNNAIATEVELSPESTFNYLPCIDGILTREETDTLLVVLMADTLPFTRPDIRVYAW